jgi:UDP-2-acetamido-2-deoxy-ribo-hexuluronate aminotransferase
MIQLINLKKQASIDRKIILDQISNNIKNADFILGKNNNSLEDKISKYLKSKYCLTCSSGTDALLMSLLAIDIKPGDIVFTTVYSYISTAEVISLLGAIPVFVDIEEDSFNIDVIKLEKAIKYFYNKKSNYPYPKIVNKNKKIHKLKGIVAVSLFGMPANFDQLKKISLKYNLPLIEDAAQSFGAEYFKKKSGNLGDISCLSFYPTKSLGCYGDGGAIVTNNKRIYDKLKSIRVHGQSKKIGNFDRIGITGRLDTIQATILLTKIKRFSKELENRTKIAKNYNHELKYLDKIKTPSFFKNLKSAWTVYTILLDTKKTRNKLINDLKKNKIQFGIYYKKPFHKQKVFKYLKLDESKFPVSENISKRCLSIPIDSYLTQNEQRKIINVIKKSI